MTLEDLRARYIAAHELQCWSGSAQCFDEDVQLMPGVMLLELAIVYAALARMKLGYAHKTPVVTPVTPHTARDTAA